MICNRIKWILLPLDKLIRSRAFWFFVGLALVPLVHYLGNLMSRPPTALEAMGWVSHHEEHKLLFTVLPDFSYRLRFPGDRDKFEKFVKKMDLQDHKVSEDEYKETFSDGERSARFSPEKKGFEIEFNSNRT